MVDVVHDLPPRGGTPVLILALIARRDHRNMCLNLFRFLSTFLLLYRFLTRDPPRPTSLTLVFDDRCPRYEWWAAGLGVKVGRGSVVLLQEYNPEDAHLLKVGPETRTSS